MQGGINWAQIQIAQIDREAILEKLCGKHGYQFISFLGQSNAQIFKVKKSQEQFAAKFVKIEKKQRASSESDKLQESKLIQGLGEIEIMMKAKEKGFNNAVKIYEHYEVTVTPKRKYLIIIMEILEKILINELKHFKKLKQEFHKKVCLKVAEAVYLMHKITNIIHRDIKPENIAIETDYKDQVLIKLLDFGLSKVCEGNRQMGTLQGRGTLAYTAPQLRADLLNLQQGQELKYDYTVDYWALGIVMLEIIFGNKITELRKDLKKNIHDIAKMIKDQELKGLVLILISVEPEDRRKADNIIMSQIRQQKGAQEIIKILGQDEYKKCQQKRRRIKKEQEQVRIEAEAEKASAYYTYVEQIVNVEVAEIKQNMVYVPQRVQKIICTYTRRQNIREVEKVVNKFIEVDEDKDEPIIAQYTVEVPEIVDILEQKVRECQVYEEIAVPVEVEEIKQIKKRVTLQIPNIIVDNKKAENIQYPVKLIKQKAVVKKLPQIQKIIQCTLVKQSAVFIHQQVVDVKQVQVRRQNPVFISRKTGKRVKIPTKAVLLGKQIKKRVERVTRKQIPKQVSLQIEKFMVQTKRSYKIIQVKEQKNVNIFVKN